METKQLGVKAVSRVNPNPEAISTEIVRKGSILLQSRSLGRGLGLK
jgi:hypothetical protein